MRATLSLMVLFLAIQGLAGFSHAQDATAARLTARPVILGGDSPSIVVEGLRPGETARLHAIRREQGGWTQDAAGQWGRTEVDLDAWADFRADDAGRIEVDTAQPLAGSYREADGLGLLWSGYKRDDDALNGIEDARLYEPARLQAGAVNVFLLRDGEIAAETRIQFAATRRGVVATTVSQPGLTGVFAAPEGAVGLPVVLQLHGSEGGSLEGARSRALQFASRGYATLAINYFSWLDEDANTPRDHVETPVEMIAEARAWLATRPEADVERFALYGVSKGAEFSLVAAVRYTWIDAVVACVPTDVVWEGYDRRQGISVNRSSWSFEGQPLPFVRLYPRIQPEEGDRDNTGRYDRSLRDLGDAGGEARIAIERSAARFLLLGSDRDEVWASGPMIRRLRARAEAAGTDDRIETNIYPTAGHQVCGTGAFPARLYADQSPDPWVKDVTAEGEASIDGWRRTLDFLHRTVGPAHVF